MRSLEEVSFCLPVQNSLGGHVLHVFVSIKIICETDLAIAFGMLLQKLVPALGNTTSLGVASSESCSGLYSKSLQMLTSLFGLNSCKNPKVSVYAVSVSFAGGITTSLMIP